jgi:hypothetical protein
MDLREQRIAENEARFRVINERLAAWSENRDAPEGARIEFFCECGDQTCIDRVMLSNPEYRALRADPTRFIVAPGHVHPEVERVVKESPFYVVVEKNERVRRIVEGMAPAGGRST